MQNTWAKLKCTFHKKRALPPFLIPMICPYCEGSKPAVSGHSTATANVY